MSWKNHTLSGNNSMPVRQIDSSSMSSASNWRSPSNSIMTNGSGSPSKKKTSSLLEAGSPLTKRVQFDAPQILESPRSKTLLASSFMEGANSTTISIKSRLSTSTPTDDKRATTPMLIKEVALNKDFTSSRKATSTSLLGEEAKSSTSTTTNAFTNSGKRSALSAPTIKPTTAIRTSPIAKAIPVRESKWLVQHDESSCPRFEEGLFDPQTGRRFYYDYELGESRWGDPHTLTSTASLSSTTSGDDVDDFVVELKDTERVVILKTHKGRKYRYDRDTGNSRWIDGK